MMTSMRKHKNWLLVILILGMVIPLMFFAVPNFMDGSTNNLQDPVVAKVGSVEIKESEYRSNLDRVASMRAGQGPRKTYAEMRDSGEADEVLKSLIDSALVTLETESLGMTVSRDYLEDKMKEWDIFQDANGNFDPKAWNAWVNDAQVRDWNKLYEAMEKEVIRLAYLDQIKASAAQVLDSELEERLLDNFTKLTVKYASIAPTVDVTDEQLRTYYDQDPAQFREPDTLVADYVAVSLLPEVTPEVLAWVDQARAGGDFAALVTEHSDGSKENGGDMGWQAPMDPEQPVRAPMFALAVGEVSEPVIASNGFYIYKVEEERVNETTGLREVRALQLYKSVTLSPEDRTLRTARAEDVVNKAKASGDLAAAATEAALTVARTGAFTKDSKTIEGLPSADVISFARAIDPATAKTDGDQVMLVNAREHVYAAKVAERTEGRIPAFEEISAKVKDAYIKAEQQKQAYLDRVQEYGEKIKAQAKSLEEAKTLFPELNITIQDTQPFDKKSFIVSGPNVQSVEVFDAFRDKEPGALAGPLKSLFGGAGSYMLELAARTEPTEEDKAKMEEDRKTMREQMIASNGNMLLNDYIMDLRERKLPTVTLSVDQEAIDRILGPGTPPPAEDAATDAASAPAVPAPAAG